MFSSAAHSTTRRRALTPALWPARRGRCRRVAQRPLPSIIIARWRTEGLDESDVAMGCNCDATPSFFRDLEERRFCTLVNVRPLFCYSYSNNNAGQATLLR